VVLVFFVCDGVCGGVYVCAPRGAVAICVCVWCVCVCGWVICVCVEGVCVCVWEVCVCVGGVWCVCLVCMWVCGVCVCGMGVVCVWCVYVCVCGVSSIQCESKMLPVACRLYIFFPHYLINGTQL